MTSDSQSIDSLLNEKRFFQPEENFSQSAHIRNIQEYEKLWQYSIDHPEEFWGQKAHEFISWFEPWQKVLEWNSPYVKWFLGGKLNASYNCLDRHITTAKKNKAAIIWEGEPGDKVTLTYFDLYKRTCKFANGLKSLGVKKGDRVTIYMPLVPELVIALQACARIGATHSVVFGGFSSEALADRINDAESHFLITADGGWRKGEIFNLKNNVDVALTKTNLIKKVVVLNRTKQKIELNSDRDVLWHDLEDRSSSHCEAEKLDSEHPLFLLYTSGSTGKPKGILHTTGGYLLQATMSCHYIFDMKDTDTFWCTADVGWITGHSYLAYGPLSLGATIVMYEGVPTFPDPGRFWRMIENYGVSIFYTAPTAIRSFIKAGSEWPNQYDLSSLRLLGTVGEPINPEAWMWYREVIGKNRCPIVDTWWQTETGSILIAPFPGATPTTPGSATRPFFGIKPEIVDKSGKSVPQGEGGFLVIEKPWPSMLRSIWKDNARYEKQYWSEIPGKYFTGDGARQDSNGYFWIMGRVDDVMNVSGHRLSTMEIESALVSHTNVAEAAVVSRPHDIKGEAVIAFVTLKKNSEPSESLKNNLKEHVVKQIGALARPEEIRFAETLPKTRSGKIMRRLLRDIAQGKESRGDVSTLEDFSVLAKLRDEE